MARPLSFLLAILVVTVGMTAASAAPAVTVTPGLLQPAASTTVSGSGFGASEAVDVYLDTTDVKLVSTTSAGAFSTALPFSGSYSPGTHSVTAVGRHSGLSAQSVVVVTVPWRTYGFGVAHYGWNPYENTLTTSTVQQLGQLWTSSIAQGSGSTPAVARPRVFVSTQAGIEALDQNTGAVLWRKFPGETFYSSPTIFGNVYVASYTTGSVYALNPTTGATIWTRNICSSGDANGSPAVVGTIVYATCTGTGAGVYALNASTGGLVWHFATSAGVETAPAVVNGVVYVGSQNSNVYALNASTGAQIWSFAAGAAVNSSISVVNGTVYFGSDDHKVYALRASNGGVLWSYTTNDLVGATPAVVGGTAYVGSFDGTLYALNAYDGSLRWSFTASSIARSVTVANGVVYFIDYSNRIYALAASYGGLLATSVLDGFTSYGAPAVSDGVVYVSAQFGSIFALAPNAGAMAKRKPAPPPKASDLHPDMGLSVSR